MSAWQTAFLALLLVLAEGTGAPAIGDCRPRPQAELGVAMLGNAPLVTLTVNGAAATFLLDTGAERTMLSAVAAQRLGVETHYEYPRKMHGLGGTLASGDAKLRSLGLGRMALADFRVLVGPVSLPGPGGKPLDGLLGADFFSSFEVDLDLAHARLTLYERPPCAIAGPPWSLAYTTIAVNRSLHDHLFFPVSLDGHRVAAFIDTGAELSAVDAAAALNLGVDAVELDRDPVATLRGAGSEVVKSRAHRFARLEIGGETLRDRVIVVTNLRLQDADLVLGVDYVRSRRVWLSYGSHQIFLARAT